MSDVMSTHFDVAVIHTTMTNSTTESNAVRYPEKPLRLAIRHVLRNFAVVRRWIAAHGPVIIEDRRDGGDDLALIPASWLDRMNLIATSQEEARPSDRERTLSDTKL